MAATAKRLTAVLLAAALCLALAGPAAAQVARTRSKPNLKIGLNRLFLNGYTYTLTDSGGTEESNSDALQGNELFFEYVFFDRVSIQLGGGVTAMERDYELTTVDTAQVDETVRSTMIGANLYFTDAAGEGFKLLAGLATGFMNVSHEFTGGTLDGQSSSVSVPVNSIKLGAEWVLDNAGARLAYHMLSGELTDTEELQAAGFEQGYDYTATMLTLGIFAFF